MAERVESGPERREGAMSGPKWWPGWYVDRLHAVPGGTPDNTWSVRSLCGRLHCYPPTGTIMRGEWQRRRLEGDVPRCKHCSRIIATAEPETRDERSPRTARRTAMAERVEATARPWKSVEGAYHWTSIDGPNDEAVAAVMVGQVGIEAAKANRRLIVEAVNAHDTLVDALRRLVAAFEVEVDTRRCTTLSLRVLNEARAALASLPTDPERDAREETRG